MINDQKPIVLLYTSRVVRLGWPKYTTSYVFIAQELNQLHPQIETYLPELVSNNKPELGMGDQSLVLLSLLKICPHVV